MHHQLGDLEGQVQALVEELCQLVRALTAGGKWGEDDVQDGEDQTQRPDHHQEEQEPENTPAPLCSHDITLGVFDAALCPLAGLTFVKGSERGIARQLLSDLASLRA